jgi:hypothetical protein
LALLRLSLLALPLLKFTFHAFVAFPALGEPDQKFDAFHPSVYPQTAQGWAHLPMRRRQASKPVARRRPS